MAAPAPKPHVYTAQISEDELPVHPWCFDEGVQNYPGRNLPRIVTDVVNAFRGNPEVSVLPHPDRLDLLYLRITPADGPAQGGEFFFWIVLDNAAPKSGPVTYFPDAQPVLGALTPSSIFSTLKAKDDPDQLQSPVTLSTGGVSICLPGIFGGGHANAWAIASTGAAKQPGFLKDAPGGGIIESQHEYKVQRKNWGAPKTLPKHGGNLVNMINIFATSVIAGPAAFVATEGEGWGFAKDVTLEKFVSRAQASRPWNRRILAELTRLFGDVAPIAAAPEEAAAEAAPPEEVDLGEALGASEAPVAEAAPVSKASAVARPAHEPRTERQPAAVPRAKRPREAAPAPAVGDIVSRVATLQRGDRVRVLWGDGRRYDGTVQTTETALERHGRVDMAIDYVYVKYDDGERGQVWDGDHPGGHGAWEVTLLARSVSVHDLDTGETELSTLDGSAQRKRRRSGDAGSTSAPSALKQLVALTEEKKQVRRSLNEAQEDLEDSEELVSQQALMTDFVQGKMDELMTLALRAGADPNAVKEIMERKYKA